MSTSVPTPTVQEIIQRYLAAIGGGSSQAKHRTQIIEGRLKRKWLRGKAVFYRKAPNKYAEKFTIFGIEQVFEGYNGKTAWQRSRKGVTKLTGKALTFFQREAPFERDAQMLTLYPEMVVEGRAQVGGRRAYVLAGPVPGEKPDRYYFDMEEGYLLKREYEITWQEQVEKFEFVYSDYREVDGLMLPFHIERPLPSQITIEVNSVLHNVELEDAFFEMP